MTLAPSLNHPQRLPLAAEVHARPFMFVEAPARVSHLAVYVGHDASRAHKLVEAFCARFGVAPPSPGAQHFVHDFGHVRLRWERHTEFCTCTFVENGSEDGDPFARPAVRHAPNDWLELLSGSVLAACHIAVERGEPLDFRDERLKRLFPAPPLVGSRISNGGEVWTDFQIGPDGYSRILLRDIGLQENQAGRMVQRLCELETYRIMALLALPVARESTQALGTMEGELTELSATMVQPERSVSDGTLLARLSALAARVEALSLRTNYRFSAGQAYYRLVRARIADLRESRIEGIPTIDEFMERRLAPAMETCASAAVRQETLATKVARTNDLLRTGVSLAQERHNQEILEQMNRNAQLQLRLQHAVEGLSVVAITYYVLGLTGYLLKAGKGMGLPLNVDAALGLMMPLACGLTWFGIRRMKHRIAKDGGSHA
ncbi:MAG: DUF3422 domain-containing protein [Betaproteobacteria bacterium]|nr:DUF3422 domain-containing protein [Betaproteobacteria bacterium]